LVKIAKKRGIFWPAFEIYGGVAGFYEYGPVGVLIKRHIINEWLRQVVYSRDGLVVEVDTPIITPRIVLKASGHEDNFTDPVTECLKCGRTFRADHLIEEKLGINAEGLPLDKMAEIIRKHNIRCPVCGGELSPPKPALLLFKTEIGPYKGSPAYLRPETAQGMFVSFKNVFNAMRNRLPLGIAQVGRVGRNEISPRQGLIRLREFTIIEIEFFFDPEKQDEEVSKYITRELLEERMNVITAEMKQNNIKEPKQYTAKEMIEQGIVKTPWMAYWMAVGNKFLRNLGIPPDKIRFDEKLPEERAHYSEQTFDQEVFTEKYGWVEVAGYSYRTTYDLSRHIKFSGADLTVFRRYEKPREKEVFKIKPNPAEIRRRYGERFAEIMKQLAKIPQEELADKLVRQGYIDLDGIRLDKECFFIKREKIKIYGEKFVPHVVEPSFGLERIFYVVLENSLRKTPERTYLALPPRIAPYYVAVFPLVSGSKEEHQHIKRIAWTIYRGLIASGISAYYDEEGSIGRRYARADEIGVPYAITIDYETLKDNTVTIRDRDTKQQERISVKDIYDYITDKIGLRNLWLELLDKELNKV
ncbi:MAG: glycine--tRNA ligase, partial [Crenarchaeota archaeon]|nr:glycine--tRNA ligase [Thermoproteota archaeon]